MVSPVREDYGGKDLRNKLQYNTIQYSFIKTWQNASWQYG